MKDTALIWIFIISSISCQTEKNEDFFEGDLILDPEKVSSSDVKNAFLSNPNRLWTGGVVFFLIDKDSILDAGVHRNIHEAIHDIEHSSCLVFKEFDKNNATGDYIKMHGDSKNSGNNCWSYMGRVGGPQVINIPSPNCTSVEIIKHEILHSTGAVHEHNRPDRDQFIKILHNNIKPDMAGNFVKREWEYLNEVHGVESFGTPYDVNSILHYPENAHGINGSKTIMPRQPLNTSIGSMGDMTITDVIELNMVYGCEIHSSLLVEYIHYTAASSNLNKIVLSTMAEQAKINFNNTEKIKLEMVESIEEMDSKITNYDSFQNFATRSMSDIVENNDILEEEMSKLKEEMAGLKSSYKWEKKISKEKIDFIVDGVLTKQSKLEEQVKKLDEIVKSKDNIIAALIEEIQDKRTNYTGTTVEKDVENLLKLNTKRNCFELATAGFTRSGFHFVDPDGEANKNPPIRAWCTFGETVEEAKTEVFHDSESRTQVAQCKEPKCYTKSITYEASKNQIEALKEISDTCTQELRYDCFLAPLTQWGGVQFGTWRDQHGLEQSLCQNCNCNTYAPTNLSDIITVDDMSLLPISRVSFGGVIAPPQHAHHTVGRLICSSTGSAGGWGTWSAWSQCPSCGSSATQRIRSRSCTNPEPSKQGQPCQGDDQEVEECGIKPCPVDCLLTEWTEFSSCSVTCGGGEKRRTREIKQQEMYGGTPCQKNMEDIQRCKDHQCPIDCEFGPWGEFEACTASCGGSMTRWRDISVEAQFGGQECQGRRNETWICNTEDCVWELGLNINPCDGGNFGYGGPWSKGQNVGTSGQAFTKDFLDIIIWKKPTRFVTIARHVNGQCTMSKTWELKDKTRSMYSYFSTYPGRIYATGDGSRSDSHISADVPQSAEGLTGTWRDPIFGTAGGLVFNWYYFNNGARIALPGGYKVPYTLPGAHENNEDLHGLGMEFSSETKTGIGSNDWQDVGKVGPDCGGGSNCQAVGTDHKNAPNGISGSCWGSYAIFVSQNAKSFNCQGRGLSITMNSN